MNSTELTTELKRLSGVLETMVSLVDKPGFKTPQQDLSMEDLAAARVYMDDLVKMNNHVLESLGKASKHIREMRRHYFLFRSGETKESVTQAMESFISKAQ